MSKNTQEKDIFENAFEVVLNATPEVLSPIIKTVADEYTFQDWNYWVVEEAKSTSPAFRRLLAQAARKVEIDGEKIAGVERDHIGIITLQSLSEDKTLFRVPPQSQWHFEANKKTLGDTRYPGHASPKDFNWFANELPFTEFLTRLFTEFQRLGFVDFKEKPPIGFRPPHKENNV